MSSILSGITSGASRTGIRVVIAGQEKIGKSTLTSGAPAPLLVPCEVGFAGITIPKTGMLQTLEEIYQFNTEVIALAQKGQFPYKSIIFDSATAVERHIHDYVLRADPAYKNGVKKTVTMESAHGGYGKAYNLANDHFNTLLQQWDQLAVHAGINIILTCHVFSAKVIDPTAGEFDTWDILLHSPKNAKTYGKREMLTQWCDVIGFLYEPIFISQANEKSMAKAVSQNKGRVIGLSRTPQYTAGNRFGILGEVSIPVPPANGWNHFANAMYQSSGIDVFNRS